MPLLARTRMQISHQREIYVLRVGPTSTMFVDEFDAKSSGGRRDTPSRIKKTLKYASETLHRQEKKAPRVNLPKVPSGTPRVLVVEGRDL